MNDDCDNDLEMILSAMKLRAPSDKLDQRVNAAFRSRSFNFRPLAIAAAILLCMGVWLTIHHQRLPIEMAQQIPLPTVENVTSQVYDDGVVAVADGVPYEQLRRRTIRQLVLVDPITHARLEMTVPTEQVVIAKVQAF